MSLFLLTFHFSLLADERPSTTGVDLFGFGESDLLFVADAYLSLMEDGATNIDWLELHKDTFLSEKDEKPRPAYFALQMIHRLANSNASIVDAESNNSLLAVHTVQRQDGSVGVMLINKDPKNSATVRVKITGATLAANGNRFDFDPRNPPSGYFTKGGPATGLGNELSIQVGPYSITDLMIPKTQ